MFIMIGIFAFIGYLIGGTAGALIGGFVVLAFFEFCLSAGASPGIGSFIAFIISMIALLAHNGVLDNVFG